MNKLQINTNELLKGIFSICLYFLLQIILAMPFAILIKKEIISFDLANLFIFLFLTITFIIIYRKTLIEDFKDFKKNYKNIIKITLEFWAKGFFIMMFASFIITALHIEENTNQAANIDLLKSAPIVEILCAVLFAPILEELVFRRGLKNYTNNKHLYAFTTGLTFGLIHVTSSITNINDLIMLLYLVPYSSLGVAFGYAYKKTNNIYGTICIHAMHNAIAIGFMILGGVI